ncbi:MAG: pyridoxal phosphate-dependent aminotransferase [Acidobacteria bacterium]|nr:pyridoxal phosphate-dependent aminotransferase [Acidobacteriota bacterium]
MFSSRFKWNLETNQLARLIEEKKRAGVKLLDLTESNPTRAGFVYPSTEILSALMQPQAMHYDPNPRGLLSARQSVADYYQALGQNVDADRIFLTASTSEAYSWLFKLLADQGDAVLVPQPSYPLFDFLAALEGVQLQPYELTYLHPSGWRIDFDSLAQSVTPQTRAIIVVNPNNPTGSYLKRKEFAQLEAFCLAHQLALIVDEVFRDYALVEDAERVTAFDATSVLTFVMNGFSKTLALPQMKLGWILPFGAAALRREAETRLELIADTFLSVNTPVQLAAPAWFQLRTALQQQILARVKENLHFLATVVENSPLRLLTTEGGWSATLEIPRRASEEEQLLRLLAEKDVLVHPGYFFDFDREAFFVLSLLPRTEIFRVAVEKIIAADDG